MKKTDRPKIEIRLCIPFYDVDPMQVVWHGHYLKYFDRARSALFDSLGVNLYDVWEKSSFAFPVVRTSVKYVFPLRHRDEIACTAALEEAVSKIVIDFEIRLVKDGRVCARGRGEQVAVNMNTMEMVYKIPEEVRRALGF